MEPTLAVLDRFEDSGDILSAIKRAFHDATHETGTVNGPHRRPHRRRQEHADQRDLSGAACRDRDRGSRSPGRLAGSRRRASRWRSTTPGGWS